ncbi:MAG TPA: response regulator [Gemmatimonadales bacterium]|nr:response regulator [Gemmatimonadales bacterium]
MSRTLIVEDSPDNAKLFRTLLTIKGHAVTALCSGDGLLGVIEGAAPDLVLMDIQLPGRDGFALLSEIRGSPFQGLRVIALSAHAMTGDCERALAAGFDGYITKPIDVRRFPGQIARALAGDSVLH